MLLLIQVSNFNLYDGPHLKSSPGYLIRKKGLVPDIIFTATDADVIKTYVGLGIGIGIIASMAFNANKDKPLIGIDTCHLFRPSTTLPGFCKGCYRRAYTYAFIECFAPHLTKGFIQNKIKEAQFTSHI